MTQQTKSHHVHSASQLASGACMTRRLGARTIRHACAVEKRPFEYHVCIVMTSVRGSKDMRWAVDDETWHQ